MKGPCALNKCGQNDKIRAMTTQIPEDALQKLEAQKVIWIASVRPDLRPHLAPIWFVWLGGHFYIGTDPHSVKVHNIQLNPQVVLALEDGTHPLICEGQARLLSAPLPVALKAAFLAKYEWNLDQETQYFQVVEIIPQKWLSW
jgi:PPOX class probable F420-dependent enzyme